MLLLLSCSAQTSRVIIIEKNLSSAVVGDKVENNNERQYESHSDEGANKWGVGKSVLISEGVIENKEKFTAKPFSFMEYDVAFEVQLLMDIAHNGINKGDFIGEYNDIINIPDKGAYNRSLTWKGTNPEQMIIKINIEKCE